MARNRTTVSSGKQGSSSLFSSSSSSSSRKTDDADSNKKANIKTPLNPLLIVVFLLITSCVSLYFYTYLPVPKPDSSTPPTDFSEERARAHLHTITSFGVRTVGTVANEVLTPDYIIEFLNNLKESKAKSDPDNNNFLIEIEVQRVSGSFPLAFLGGFTNLYNNVTNILLRISDKRNPEALKTSLLVSGHYDSSLGTVGASDNAASVATMMEIAANIIALPNPPPFNALIFNFNGAEETILQAAHGFITQHPFASTVRAFINLEAAGSGGRELVFQTGPYHSWLAKAYIHASHYPYASIIGQEIFQSGIVPSDTDFRVYRDFGHIPGLDMARISNGFAYHTHLDDEHHIPAGSLQRCGENVLSTVLHLLEMNEKDGSRKQVNYSKYQNALGASSNSNGSSSGSSSSSSGNDRDGLAKFISPLTNPQAFGEHDTEAVFFDVLGVFAVIYSHSLGQAINIASSVLSIVSLLLWKFTSENGKRANIFYSIVTHFRALVAAAAVSALIGGVFSFGLGVPLLFYGQPLIVLGLFVCPSLAVIICTHRNRGVKRLSQIFHNELEREVFVSSVVIWIGILSLLTCFNLGSAYMILILAISPVIGRCLASLLAAFTAKEYSQSKSFSSKGQLKMSAFDGLFWSLRLMGVFVALLLVSHHFIALLEFFIPIMGRSGSVLPADVFIGFLVGFLVGLSTFSLASTIHAFSLPSKHIERLLWVLFALTCLYSLTTVQPFHPEHPKRLFVQHVQRRFHDLSGSLATSDDKVWLIPFDGTGLYPLTPFSGSLLRAATGLELPTVLEMRNRKESPDDDVLNEVQTRNIIFNQLAQPAVANKEDPAHVYGALPWYLPVRELLPYTWYVDAGELRNRFLNSSEQESLLQAREKRAFTADHSLEVLNVATLKDQGRGESQGESQSQQLQRNVTLKLTGPDHVTLYIQAVNSTSKQPVPNGILSWSFADAVQFPDSDGCYFIFAASGSPGLTSWDFWITTQSSSNSDDIRLIVASGTHYLSDLSTESQIIMDVLPSYIAKIGWFSTYTSWIV